MMVSSVNVTIPNGVGLEAALLSKLLAYMRANITSFFVGNAPMFCCSSAFVGNMKSGCTGISLKKMDKVCKCCAILVTIASIELGELCHLIHIHPSVNIHLCKMFELPSFKTVLCIKNTLTLTHTHTHTEIL